MIQYNTKQYDNCFLNMIWFDTVDIDTTFWYSNMWFSVKEPIIITSNRSKIQQNPFAVDFILKLALVLQIFFIPVDKG